jgi:hypothetical protein
MALLCNLLFDRAPAPRPGRATVGLRWAGWSLGLCFHLGALGASLDGSPAPHPPPLSQVEEGQSAQHRSVFISDPAVGKDPFFPSSKRRIGQVVVPPPVPAVVNTQNPGEFPWDLFTLKGVSISTARRLAIINNYTLAEGEEREVKVAGQVYRVRCVTVQEQSAVISIKNRTRELSLREGL